MRFNKVTITHRDHVKYAFEEEGDEAARELYYNFANTEKILMLNISLIYWKEEKWVKMEEICRLL